VVEVERIMFQWVEAEVQVQVVIENLQVIQVLIQQVH
jgi:hypothetical protein